MPRFRSVCLYVLSVALSAAINQAGRTQTPPTVADKPTAAVSVTKIYALAGMGFDSNRGSWVAETIPKTIEPATWKPKNGDVRQDCAGDLSYEYETAVLVVYNTPAVHAQIDEFLKELKKGAPMKSAKAKKASQRNPAVNQAQFVAPPLPLAPAQSAYPAVGPVQPKHLFHFSIRYEGDGIFDANVVKFAKALHQAATNTNAPTANLPPPAGVITGGPPGWPMNGYFVPPPPPVIKQVPNWHGAPPPPTKPPVAPAPDSAP
jgi:hypothetical protein